MATSEPHAHSFRAFRRRIRVLLLRRFVRFVPTERQRLFTLTVVSGLLCGLVAVAFHLALRRVEGLLLLMPIREVSPWLLLAIPTAGGAVCGVLLQYVPEAAGSGIPQVKKAYVLGPPRVSPRTAAGKFLITVLQIGTGASLGREGPTVQICAGVSTLLGEGAALSPQGLRRMLPAAAAAGIAAAFNAPIAAVVFVIEEIVGDLDQAVLSGVIVAAAIAAVVERSVLGEHPVFDLKQQYSLEHPSSLVLYALLGIAAAVVSVLFTDSLLHLRGFIQRVKSLPRWSHPAIGGLVTGALALVALKWLGLGGITGAGYDTLLSALHGHLALQAVVVLLVLKLVATVFSYGSGGCGGIFAPSLFLGGMLGAAFGHLDLMLFGRSTTIFQGLAHEHLGAFALVGMGAVFAGIVRAPITSVLIIFEMTSGYSLVLPLMIANMTAYALARHWRPTQIYHALLEQDGVKLPKRVQQNPLDGMPVSAAMTVDAVMLRPEWSVARALEAVQRKVYNLYPVVDEKGSFRGLVSAAALRIVASENAEPGTVADHIAYDEVVFPETPVPRAAAQLHRSGIHLLAVVQRGEGRKFLGLLTAADIVRASAMVGEQRSGVGQSEGTARFGGS